MAKKKSLHVTDTELAVLRVLWSQGKKTAREITESVYSGYSASDFATVHSMLKRLEGKRAVGRDRNTHPHRFRALVSETDVAGFKLAEMANKVSGGSMAPFILHLLDAGGLSEEEAKAIGESLKQYKARK